MVEPMTEMERFNFRVEVARLVGDNDDQMRHMVNMLGESPAGGAEIAASVASLA